MTVTLADLRAAPHDRERLAVYADWLQAQGEPRGELIAVSQLAEATTDPAEYAWARARAHTLASRAPSLQPPAPGTIGGAPRSMWTSWSRGFIRRLELLIARPDPEALGVPPGPRGWTELLRAILAHPSAALLEHLVLRIDAPADPVEQSALAVRVALDALEPLRALLERRPGPALQLDLWTSALPELGQRERLAHELRPFRPYWFSWDLTMIPPPRRHSAAELLARLAELRRADGQPVAFDMMWFDRRGQFLARLDARSGVVGGVEYEAQWSMHLRRLAELDTTLDDPLLERSIDRAFAPLAARFSREAALVPAMPLTLTPLAPARLPPHDAVHELLARLQALGIDGAQLRDPLLGFPSPLRWRWLERRCGAKLWRGFVGLGPDDLLALGLLDSAP